MNKYLLALALITSVISTKAQVQHQSINELKVGDKVPDISLSNVKSEYSNIHLSDYKGKLLLLDFWSTHCSGCIAGFPKLDSLQKKFKEKLKIILINNFEDKATINRFFCRWEKLTKNKIENLLVTSGNPQLYKLFKYEAVPFQVLIDSGGHIVAFPGYDQLTSTSDTTLYIANFLFAKFDCNSEK